MYDQEIFCPKKSWYLIVHCKGNFPKNHWVILLLYILNDFYVLKFSAIASWILIFDFVWEFTNRDNLRILIQDTNLYHLLLFDGKVIFLIKNKVNILYAYFKGASLSSSLPLSP